jgi:hypothetical protein
MVEGKICPFCQVRNAQNVERCVRCGRPFPGSKDQHETTDQITKTEPELTGFLPNVDQLAPLAKDTLVLFVNGEEAVLLEDMQEVILGRPMVEMPFERTFDLTNYGGVTLGVSRRHIRISYVNGTFKVMDLGSTNGTTLNGRYLPPARSQNLRPFDQLALGQLRLMVYFAAEPGEQGKSLLLTDKRATKSWRLTPDYLESILIPYIQSISDIQKIVREVRGQPVEDIQVLYIQTGERPAQVRLGLLVADEAIEVVRQWIVPWQRIHADQVLSSDEANGMFLLPEIRDLVASVIQHLISSSSELETFALQEKLFDPVSFIATSGLEFTLESVQSYI